MRISGRYGQVTVGTSPETPLGSISGFDASFARDYLDVTAFLDSNKVYVPGLADVSGTIKGFYNMDEGSPSAGESLAFFDAAEAVDPVHLKLIPDINNPLRNWEGDAYLDMKVDCQVSGAVTLESSFKASDEWIRN